MFSTGYLPVLGGGIEASVSQVLLEKPQAISRIVKLHSVDSEAISQSVWAYVATLTSLRVYQLRQPRFLSTVPDYLPCSMTINTEYQLLTIMNNRTTAANIVSKQAQSVIIQGQYPLPAVFLLPDQCFIYLGTAPGAKSMSYTQSGPTLGTG